MGPDGQAAHAARIVAGIDGSPSSLEALAWAARQAEMTGVTLEVVIAWEWPTTYGWVPILPPGYDPADEARKVLDPALASVASSHPSLKVTERVVEGHPAPVLIEASRGADLLVVGNRGHGEFAGMLLGSVSEHCAGSAHCPVVVYRGD
jgi:nucleotide-binding universal stress UspA family protein